MSDCLFRTILIAMLALLFAVSASLGVSLLQFGGGQVRTALLVACAINSALCLLSMALLVKECPDDYAR